MTDSARKKVLGAVAVVLIIASPALISAFSGHASASGLLMLGTMLGIFGMLGGGKQVGLIMAALLVPLVPLALAAGASPLSGGAYMGLLCLLTASSAVRGLHRSLLVLPLLLAFVLISPPAIGSAGADRLSMTYQLSVMAIMLGGALWALLVISVVARSKPMPELTQLPRRETAIYTTVLTVLCAFSAFAVLQWLPGSNGAWLILTLIVVVQFDPAATFAKSRTRVAGTVAGAIVAGAIGLLVSSASVVLVLGVVCLCVMIVAKMIHNDLLYVMFLTPSVVLFTATGSVIDTDIQRLGFTLGGAALAVIASLLILALVDRSEPLLASSEL